MKNCYNNKENYKKKIFNNFLIKTNNKRKEKKQKIIFKTL